MKELGLALKHKAKNPDAKNTKADILVGLGKADEAIELYEGALEDNPHYYQSSIALGNIYAGKGDLKKAHDFFQRVHDTAPTDKNAMYGLALMMEKEGEVAGAIKSSRKP